MHKVIDNIKSTNVNDCRKSDVLLTVFQVHMYRTIDIVRRQVMFSRTRDEADSMQMQYIAVSY